MSALISGVYFDSVLVATDTYSGAIPGRRAQKLFSLPHLPAVIVGRGSARLLKLIWLEAAALECPFDDLVEAPPSIIRKATGGPTASTRHTRTFLFPTTTARAIRAADGRSARIGQEHGVAVR